MFIKRALLLSYFLVKFPFLNFLPFKFLMPIIVVWRKLLEEVFLFDAIVHFTINQFFKYWYIRFIRISVKKKVVEIEKVAILLMVAFNISKFSLKQQYIITIALLPWKIEDYFAKNEFFENFLVHKSNF